jgi:hypothetical protein
MYIYIYIYIYTYKIKKLRVLSLFFELIIYGEYNKRG